MRRAPFVIVLLMALAPVLAGCSDDEGRPVAPATTFDLVFTGDATFQGPHGGQTINVGVVEQGSGTLVAEQTGTVAADADPSFSFTFTDVLEEGTSYDLVYWIDSNFAGGQTGVCDAPDDDHQWLIAVGEATDDVTVADTHRPAAVEPVCDLFD